MRKPHALALFGSAGHAKSVRDVAERAGWEVRLQVAPDAPVSSTIDHIADDLEGVVAAQDRGLRIVPAVGDGPLRRELALLARQHDVLSAAVIALTATVARGTVIGDGTVVLEHAHVGPGARIGLASVLNTGSILEHDSTIGTGCHLAPHSTVLGGCQIGDDVLVGAGAVVLPGRKVGRGATVGAGAVVGRDVGPGDVVVGIPARCTAS